MNVVSAFCLFWATVLSTATGFSTVTRFLHPCHDVLTNPSHQILDGSGRLLRSCQLFLGGASLDDYTDDEIQEMRELILSLSFEQTDESRRSRLENIFSESSQRANGMPERFATLFDRLVIKIGDEVQTEAKKRFYEAQAAAESSGEIPGERASGEEENGLGEEEKREKSPDELQLWALVDMMVQSKTLAKKAKTDPGALDSFQ